MSEPEPSSDDHQRSITWASLQMKALCEVWLANPQGGPGVKDAWRGAVEPIVEELFDSKDPDMDKLRLQYLLVLFTLVATQLGVDVATVKSTSPRDELNAAIEFRTNIFKAVL